ncbi:MAG: YdeI/OmpD-associated family protein [Solirubrobacteraceae bacterium]
MFRHGSRPAWRAAADYSGCQDAGIAAKPASTPDDGEIILCETLAGWEAWLDEHHAASTGVWLKIAKKGAGHRTVGYPDVLDAAICFGWIDARRQGYDETFFLQRFTPRGARSIWSQNNRDKATALIDAGRMRAAGMAQVRAAQDDGRWHAAYEPQSRATVPPDFQQALDESPAAREFFATLRGANRYAFLFRLHHVKTPAARKRRIAQYIETLSAGRTLN